MLGYRLSQKSVLWPLVVLFTVAWLLVTWGFLRPRPSNHARDLARQWLDRGIRAYDYASHEPDKTVSGHVKKLALDQLQSLWKSIQHAGMADDSLWLDWSVISLRVAQDFKGAEANPWKDSSEDALSHVSQPSRTCEYYVDATRALNGEPLSEPELDGLRQMLKRESGSWTTNFLAWKLGANPSVEHPASKEWSGYAFAQFMMIDWIQWIACALAGLLIVPAWLCVRSPLPRRKRSERLQKLWPLGPMIFFVMGGMLIQSAAERLLPSSLNASRAWYDFAKQAGPNWTAAVWKMMFISLLFVTPMLTRAGMASGWGSTWCIAGVEWRDFKQLRFWFIGLVFACALLAAMELAHACLDMAGWGSSLLDIASRWPFSSNSILTASNLALIIVIGPIVEELTFRGYLLAAFRQRFNPTMAIWMTSVLFAAGHAYSFWGTVQTLAAGLLLGWIRLRTGRLSASIIAHMSVNGLVCLGMLLWKFN